MENTKITLNKEVRGKGWFKVGNIFMDEYVRYIGHVPALVYIFIKRYENNDTRYSWPSEKLIANKLKISERTVVRAIKILIKHKLLTKQKIKNKGQWPHNKYYLTHSIEWLINLTNKQNLQVTTENRPHDKIDKNHMTQNHIKNTNIKKETISEKPEQKSFNFKDYTPDFIKEMRKKTPF